MKKKTSEPHWEMEIITIFSDLARLLGHPRSLGEIYGLLFTTSTPLSMEDIIKKLGISKGSASQGLRHLREYGAIRGEKSRGDRREYYTPELELKKLVGGFLRERLLPRLEGGQARIRAAKSCLGALSSSDRATATERISKLHRWHSRALATLPLALSLLDD